MVRTRIAAGPDDGTLEIPSASTARTAGDVVIYGGDTLGIVADTVASGELYYAFTKGRFELAKATGVPFTAGEDVYWDTTGSGSLTTVATGNTRAGVAARAASTTAARGRVNLNAPNVQLAPQT